MTSQRGHGARAILSTCRRSEHARRCPPYVLDSFGVRSRSVVQVKKKQVRQAILDSAFDLFSERGYHATTLQEVAEFAGVGVSSLYSYFPSKLHLLYAVFEPWHKDAVAQLEKRVLRLKSPRERLRAVLIGL